MRPGSHLRVHDSACDPMLPRGPRAQETVWGQALRSAIWGDRDPEWAAGDDAEGRFTPSNSLSTATKPAGPP
jgi:hypothetical protein